MVSDSGKQDDYESEKEELLRLAKSLKVIPTPELERDRAQLLEELRFVEEQIAAEPELYERGDIKANAQRRMGYLREKITLIGNEYEKRQRDRL